MLLNPRFRVMALKTDFSNTNKKYKEALKYYGIENDSISENSIDIGILPLPVLKYSRTLSKQASLPRMPVPSLDSTMNKYLLAVKHLIDENDYETTKNIVDCFRDKNGIGQQLQRFLIERSKNTDNWLATWWLDKIYLEPRYNIVINVNPGTLYPNANYSDLNGKLSFATKYIYGFLEFNKYLAEQKIPTEKLGDSYLCMDQYFKLIGTCRVPKKDKDDINIMKFHNIDFRKFNFITVMFNNRIFSLNVIDSITGLSYSQEEIFYSLKSIVENANDKGLGIGILTTEDRDIWAENYAKLTKNQKNRQNFEKISSSLFVLCLDNDNSCISTDKSLAASQILHGNKEFTANRFFDKTIQAIFCDNGVWGVCFEHSVAEAVPHSFMNDFIYNYIVSTENEKIDVDESLNDYKDWTNLYEELEFDVSEEIKNQILKSNNSISKLIDNLDLQILNFDLFGKNFPKSQKISPDAFVQIAMQLAFFRLHNKLGNTYESGSLRKFHLGRTDIIRTCSSDAEAFVKSMPQYDSNNNIKNKTFTNEERSKLLLKAINSHRLYTNNVINCESFDRHLLGLKLISLENNLPMPDLFKDTSYEKACHYHISSSQVSSKYEAVTCYGPAVEDGYGACYNITEKKIMFGISSNKTCKETNAKMFANYIQNSLIDCQNLLIKVNHKL